MERVYHPAFGWLTDEEDIRVYLRQQEEEEYRKMMEKAYDAEYNRMLEMEAEDYHEYEVEMYENPEYEGKPISFEKWLEKKYGKNIWQ